MRKPSQKTYRQALDVLDGIEEIANNKQLVHGTYVSTYSENERLREAGSICGGHTACLLGSAAIAAGWSPGGRGDFYLDGFVRHRPALRLALEALDFEAIQRIRKLADSPSRGRRAQQARAYFKVPDHERSHTPGRVAESYFEEVLLAPGTYRNPDTWRSTPTVRREVVDLCRTVARKLRREARNA